MLCSPVFFSIAGELDVSKNRGGPKMDGENHGSKPYEQIDDLGGFPPIFGNTQLSPFFWLICFPKSTNAQNFLRQENNPVAALSDMMARDLGGSQIGSCHGCLGDLLGMKNYPVIWGL